MTTIIKRMLILATLLLAAAEPSRAFSLDLDSIARWGRFPKFCVDTYRWGDRFFNGYDTTYVKGTGYKFNAKLRTESWTDYYHLKFDNKSEMMMISDPSTSAGIYLTYLAVSAGYDINVSKYFNGGERARKRWNFQFNCMLFSAEFYLTRNDVGTRVSTYKTQAGDEHHPHLKFNGIDASEMGVNAFYYFNHRRYSQAAAFNISRVQIKNGGSFFAGFNYVRQKYDFDFNSLPDEIKEIIPDNPPDLRYRVKNNNYYLSFGYGYNWVFAPKWLFAISEAPMIGLTDGYFIDTTNKKTIFTAFNKLKMSVVFDHRQWFAGAILSAQTCLVGERERMLLSQILSMEISAGFRFNLW